MWPLRDAESKREWGWRRVKKVAVHLGKGLGGFITRRQWDFFFFQADWSGWPCASPLSVEVGFWGQKLELKPGKLLFSTFIFAASLAPLLASAR